MRLVSVQEAYKKYADGLALIGNVLKEDVDSMSKPIVNVHKHLLEFAKKSTERLVHILDNFGIVVVKLKLHIYAICWNLICIMNTYLGSDSENSFNDQDSSRLSAYAELSKNLPGIITGKPAMPLNFSGNQT